MKKRHGDPKFIPTEEEIAHRAAAIRATWTDAQMRSRSGQEPQPWAVPRLIDGSIRVPRHELELMD